MFHPDQVDRQQLKSREIAGQEVPPAALQVHRKCKNKRLRSVKHSTHLKLEQTGPLRLPEHFWSETTFMNHVTSVDRHKKKERRLRKTKTTEANQHSSKMRHYLVMCIFPGFACHTYSAEQKGKPISATS